MKQQPIMPAHEPHHRHTDWIISNNSNVHVAKHRECFKSYIPFDSLTTSITGGSMRVLGLGDVHLEVHTEQGQSTLILHDVLHCPSATCNILGLAGLGRGYEMQLGGPDDSWLRHTQTGTVYIVDHVVLWKLWLVGQEKGQSSLRPGGAYVIQANWPKSERERFEAQKGRTEPSVGAGAGAEGPGGLGGVLGEVKAA